jgi:hypothetical protein
MDLVSYVQCGPTLEVHQKPLLLGAQARRAAQVTPKRDVPGAAGSPRIGSCVSRDLLYPARDVVVALGPRLCEDHIGAVLALKNGERALVRR